MQQAQEAALDADADWEEVEALVEGFLVVGDCLVVEDLEGEVAAWVG